MLSDPTLVVTTGSNSLEGVKVTCSSSPELKRTAHEQICRKIVELEALILSLKKTNNTISDPARLPDEILAEIFQWVAEDDKSCSRPKWIGVTYVCTHWRDVALRCASLWSVIFVRDLAPGPVFLQAMTHYHYAAYGMHPLPPNNIDSPQWLKERLLRSKATELRVTATIDRHSISSELASFFNENIHRFRELTILPTTTTHFLPTASLPILAGTAQSLRSLTISLPVEGPNPPRQKASLPHNLFGGSAPYLHRLCLRGCDISPYQPVFHNLTSLQIVKPRTQIPVNELYRLLRYIQGLESLTLVEAFSLNDEEDESARLPHLSHLELTDHWYTCHNFIENLDYPSSATHTILGYPYGHDSIDTVCKELREFGGCLADQIGTVRCLQLDHPRATDILFLRAWASTGTHPHLPSDVPLIRFSIILPDSLRDAWPLSKYSNDALYSEVFQELWIPFLSDSLESLHVSDIPLPAEVWRSSFGMLPSFKDVHIRQYGTSFLEALCSQSDSSLDTSSQPPVLFGALRNIATDVDSDHERLQAKSYLLKAYQMGSSIRGKSNSIPSIQQPFVMGEIPHGAEAFMRLLKTCLQIRHNQGAGLHKLHVLKSDGLWQHWQIWNPYYSAMLEVVQEVHWEWMEDV
ncbi:hypothetical protein DXG01_015482 [Tephrocybe rancida]|nr:hypothetical protein DXG01_015482 [Tephrocybe rancida]